MKLKKKNNKTGIDNVALSITYNTGENFEFELTPLQVKTIFTILGVKINDVEDEYNAQDITCFGEKTLNFFWQISKNPLHFKLVGNKLINTDLEND